MHKIKTDLTKINGTIGNVLTKNYSTIMSLPDPCAVKSYIEDLFREADINTPASHRLINNLTKSHTLTNSLTIVYNSVLAAQGNKVIS